VMAITLTQSAVNSSVTPVRQKKCWPPARATAG